MLILLLILAFFLTPIAAQAQPERIEHQDKRKLVVAVMPAPPFSMQDEDGSWTGLTVDLWKEIANELGLEYEFKSVDLQGLLSGLEDGTLDAGATGLTVTAAREAKFDFSAPYFAANEAVAVNSDQKPSLLQVFHGAFLNWGLLTVFLLMVGVMVLGAAILWFLERGGAADHYGGKSRKAFGRSLYWSTTVLSGHDLPKSTGWQTLSPETLAGRLFGVVWMVAGIMFISVFTGTVASVLTSKQLQGLVNDPSDLHRVRVGTVADSVGQEYLNRQHIKHTAYSPGPLDLMRGLANHQIDAAVYNGPILSYYAKSVFNNKIIVLRFSLKHDFMAIPLKPGSPLRKPINRALLKIVETKKWQTIQSSYLDSD